MDVFHGSTHRSRDLSLIVINGSSAFTRLHYVTARLRRDFGGMDFRLRSLPSPKLRQAGATAGQARLAEALA